MHSLIDGCDQADEHLFDQIVELACEPHDSHEFMSRAALLRLVFWDGYWTGVGRMSDFDREQYALALKLLEVEDDFVESEAAERAWLTGFDLAYGQASP